MTDKTTTLTSWGSLAKVSSSLVLLLLGAWLLQRAFEDFNSPPGSSVTLLVYQAPPGSQLLDGKNAKIKTGNLLMLSPQVFWKEALAADGQLITVVRSVSAAEERVLIDHFYLPRQGKIEYGTSEFVSIPAPPYKRAVLDGYAIDDAANTLEILYSPSSAKMWVLFCFGLVLAAIGARATYVTLHNLLRYPPRRFLGEALGDWCDDY